MGEVYKYKCPYCKKDFDWYTGYGMLGQAVYHCNKCGKSKRILIEDTLNEDVLHCKCGGAYEVDAPVRCPKCKQVVSESDMIPDSITMWD